MVGTEQPSRHQGSNSQTEEAYTGVNRVGGNGRL